MAIQDLLVGILSGLYKISNPRKGKDLQFKNSTKFQYKQVLSKEVSCPPCGIFKILERDNLSNPRIGKSLIRKS